MQLSYLPALSKRICVPSDKYRALIKRASILLQLVVTLEIQNWVAHWQAIAIATNHTRPKSLCLIWTAQPFGGHLTTSSMISFALALGLHPSLLRWRSMICSPLQTRLWFRVLPYLQRLPFLNVKARLRGTRACLCPEQRCRSAL